MREKIAEQLFLDDWDEGLLQGEILNGDWGESPEYLKSRYREQGKKKLALIAEKVRAIENPYAGYNPIDVHLEVKIFELCRQKVLGILEGK